MRHKSVAWVLIVTFLGSACWASAQPKKDWTVGILVYDGVYNSEFVAPMDVSITSRLNAKPMSG